MLKIGWKVSGLGEEDDVALCVYVSVVGKSRVTGRRWLYVGEGSRM